MGREETGEQGDRAHVTVILIADVTPQTNDALRRL